MPKVAKELSAVEVNRLTERKPDGKTHHYPVGGVPGLLLRITKSGAASWIYRYHIGTRINQKGHSVPTAYDLTLGPYSTTAMTLKKARDAAGDYRRQVRDGGHPLRDRQRAQQATLDAIAADRLTTSQQITFKEAVAGFHVVNHFASHKAENAWLFKMNQYAVRIIGHLPVSKLEQDHIVEVLLQTDNSEQDVPLWIEKHRTATEVRRYMVQVIDWAYAEKKIKGVTNPALLTNSLKMRLPRVKKKVQHFAALPYTEIQRFCSELATSDENDARALRFLILTAARSGEVCGATWEEIDLKRRLWVIPAERMKADKEHRVYLSDAALDIIGHKKGLGLLFPTATGRPYKDAPLSLLTREIGPQLGYKATVHGMRSTFRDWATENTDYPEFILELALAHTQSDETIAAYKRSDLADKRRDLLTQWAEYVTSKPAKPAGKVVPMRKKA